MSNPEIKPEISEENPLLPSFKESLRPRTPEYRRELVGLYTEYLTSQRELLSDYSTDFLQATGEYPRAKTPYDVVNSPEEQDLNEMATGMMERHIYLEALNHPLIHEKFEEKRKEGWQPLPPKDIQLFNQAINNKEAVTYEDFVLSFSEDEPDEDSAQTMLGTGLVTHATTETVSWRVSGSSMSALNSAPLIASLGMAGSMGFTPIDGQWGNVHNAAAMLNRSFELLVEDPFVKNHPNQDYIIQRATGLMGVTLKAQPKDALQRVQTFFDEVEFLEGNKLLCRVYDPRSMPRMIETVRALKDKFGDRVVIIAGKVTKNSQYEQAVEAGANAFDVGIGEGEICDTPGVTSATGNNLLTAYKAAQLGLQIPLICDGGTGRQIPVAIAVGASVAMKSKALSGGTLEQNPSGWVYVDKAGDHFKQYFGEASEAEKYAGGKLDPTGLDVMFNEGHVGKVPINKRYLTAIKNLFKFNESLATAAVFQRVQTLDDLQKNPTPDVWRYTSHAAEHASVHHR